jgi:hypothetical protein
MEVRYAGEGAEPAARVDGSAELGPHSAGVAEDAGESACDIDFAVAAACAGPRVAVDDA